MPKKTAADKARNSIEYNKREIQRAYEDGEIDAPLVAAVSWLRAALKQRARESPEAASALYKHATGQLSTYAEQLQNRIIEKSQQEVT